MSPVTVFDPWQSACAWGDVLATTDAPEALWQARRAQRLAALVRAAVGGSRFYREYLGAPALASPASWQRLPAVRKRDLMARFDDWVSDPAVTLAGLREFTRDPARRGQPYLGRYIVWESSGSSGEPALFVQDARALAVGDALEAARGPASLAGSSGLSGPWHADARIAYVGATDGHFAGIVSFERLRQLNPWLRAMSRSFSFMQPLERLVDALNDFAPSVLCTYPSMAWVLAQAKTAGGLRIAPRVLWTGGETLTPGLRRTLGACFGAPVRDSYGSSECLTIASECRCGRLHLNADWAILEPVDDRGRPVPPGHVGATTLLTNLANHVQPILRYDIGDRVRFVPGPCPCGSRLPVIEVQGRCDDVLTLADTRGRAVHLAPLALTTVLEDGAGAFDFQLRQHAPQALVLELYGHATALEQRRACKRAAAALHDFLRRQGLASVGVRVRAMPAAPQRGRSGKQRRVLCEPAAADRPARRRARRATQAA